MRLWMLFLLPLQLFGSIANIYYAGASAGSNNGTSCANAYIYSDGTNGFNVSGKWGAGSTQIGSDTTVHLCGTFTAGSAGTTELTAQGSGTSGHPVTILFESGAVLTSPSWNFTGAINLSNQSFITVDGGTDCGWINGADTVCNGTIQNTASGTGLANHSDSVGILAAGSTNVVIKRINIINIYVHTQCEAPTGCDVAVDYSNVDAVKAFPSAANLTINNLYVHDCGWCLNGYGTNLLEFNNVIFNCSHGIQVGANSGSYTNMIHHDNHIHDMANWDTGVANAYHNDGIYDYAETGGVIAGLQVYNNIFDGDPGNNITAWIFQDTDAASGLTGIQDYNNTMSVPNGRIMNSGSIDLFGFGGCVGCGDVQIYNNTVIDNNTTGACYGIGAGSAGAWTVKFENNIAVGCGTDVFFTNVTITTANKNTYDNACAGLAGNCFGWNGSDTASFTSWKTTCGCDANSQFTSAASINVSSSTFKPQSGSNVIGFAANLTSLSIPNLDLDQAGTARPAVAAWDGGAFQFQAPSTASGVCSGSACSVFR